MHILGTSYVFREGGQSAKDSDRAHSPPSVPSGRGDGLTHRWRGAKGGSRLAIFSPKNSPRRLLRSPEGTENLTTTPLPAFNARSVGRPPRLWGDTILSPCCGKGEIPVGVTKRIPRPADELRIWPAKAKLTLRYSGERSFPQRELLSCDAENAFGRTVRPP